MADNDPWLGIEWKVYAVQGANGNHLKPSAREGAFTLAAVTDAANGHTAYYTVNFAVGDMPPAWDGLLLYPHGLTQFAPPLPLLQPWTPSGDAPWLAAADAIRAGLSDAMARLEGVLSVNGSDANLTLVCVPKATTAGLPLLVLELANPQGSGVRDTPTGGHGDN